MEFPTEALKTITYIGKASKRCQWQSEKFLDTQRRNGSENERKGEENREGGNREQNMQS